jgi:hypothetical protein
MRWIAGVLGLVVLGCAVSKQTITAGQVGCQPSEIEISNGDSSVGWTESSETWQAECKGRKFVCSKTNAGGVLGAANNAPPSSSQVYCKEQLETAGAVAPSGSAVAVTAGGNAKGAEPTPPTGAAGFEFGSSLEAAKSACTAAGKAWSSESAAVATCSGPVTKTSYDAFVSLKFCGSSLCFVSLRLTDSPAWSNAVGELETKLSRKYGAPQSKPAIAAECQAEPAFTRCFKEGDQRLRYQWSWTSGEQITLLAGKPSGGGEPSIRVQYKQAQQADAAGL